MKALLRWGAVAAVAVAAAIAIALEYQRGVWLRVAVERERDEYGRLAVLVEENRRLKAAQASRDELAAMANARAELAQLRESVKTLNQKLREPEPAPAGKAAASGTIEWPALEWRNAGRATPQSATETALWAAVSGEIDVLAGTLMFDERGRRAAERLLADLPEASRRTYRTPERLVALLAAKDVPMGAVMAKVAEVTEVAPDEVRLRVGLSDSDEVTKSARLTLRRMSDGWRMVVSERAVAKYAASLTEGGEEGLAK